MKVFKIFPGNYKLIKSIKEKSFLRKRGGFLEVF